MSDETPKVTLTDFNVSDVTESIRGTIEKMMGWLNFALGALCGGLAYYMAYPNLWGTAGAALFAGMLLKNIHSIKWHLNHIRRGNKGA